MSGSEHQHEANLNYSIGNSRGLTSGFHLGGICLADINLTGHCIGPCILSLTFYMQRASKTFGVIIDHVIPRDLQSLPYRTLNKHGAAQTGSKHTNNTAASAVDLAFTKMSSRSPLPRSSGVLHVSIN